METVLFLSILGTFLQLTHGYLSRSTQTYGYGSDNYDLDSECGNSMLQCVPKTPTDSCELVCPRGFSLLPNAITNTACYLFSSPDSLVDDRTFLDSADYCKNVGGHSLWIETKEELDSILAAAGDIDANIYIGAEYDDRNNEWVWTSNGEKADWNVILRGLPGYTTIVDNIDNIANENQCLFLELKAAEEVTTIDPVTGMVSVTTVPASKTVTVASDCHTAARRFICKMGISESRCGKTSNSQCCFSSTFDYYINNRDNDYGIALTLHPSGCKVQTPAGLVPCATVRDLVTAEGVKGLDQTQVVSATNPAANTVNLFLATRIDSSYFYITNKATCEANSKPATIPSEKVHMYITVLMASKETYFGTRRVAIGLTYNALDREAYWVNRKREDYYDETYWFAGEPRRDADADEGCAAYVVGPEGNSYGWRLYSKADCATSHRVCEIEIYKEPPTVASLTRACGQKKDRGALARARYTVFDSSEARFAEFPWQAIIMDTKKVGREVKRVFACSGALIHERFVLTSAHCVASMTNHNDLIVSLGQHDIHDEDGALLKPIIRTVGEVIMHHGFNVRENFKDDFALLQLSTSINVKEAPHVGLACLPKPEEIGNYGGKWTCFNVGWNSDGYGSHASPGRSSVLQRIAVNFTSEEFCRRANQEYYYSIKQHHGGYGSQHNQYYSSREPELLCTQSKDGECLTDSSSTLVCKKEDTYVQKPFYQSFYRPVPDSQNPQPTHTRPSTTSGHSTSSNTQAGSSYSKTGKMSGERYRPQTYGYTAPGGHSNTPYNVDYEEDYIINSYGDNRFDEGTWYIIGIGNAISQCNAPLSSNHYGPYNPYSTSSYNAPYNPYGNSRPYTPNTAYGNQYPYRSGRSIPPPSPSAQSNSHVYHAASPASTEEDSVKYQGSGNPYSSGQYATSSSNSANQYHVIAPKSQSIHYDDPPQSNQYSSSSSSSSNNAHQQYPPRPSTSQSSNQYETRPSPSTSSNQYGTRPSTSNSHNQYPASPSSNQYPATSHSRPSGQTSPSGYGSNVQSGPYNKGALHQVFSSVLDQLSFIYRHLDLHP